MTEPTSRPGPSPRFIRRRRDVLAVRGPDAGEYLQGQLSQDVDGLVDGASAWSFVLQPTGRVDAWLRITRRTGTDYLLDVDGGFGEAVVERLRRFLLRTDCAVESLAWEAATLLAGPGPADEGPEPPEGGIVVAVDWPDLEAFDLLAPSVPRPEGVGEHEEGVPSDWEVERVRVGLPAMGSEIDGDTIPGATGLVERSVNFTKGCYTGQELVARIDSRTAGTPTRLVRATGRGELPPVGAELWSGGEQVGHLTSSVTENFPEFAALGYRKRSALDLEAAEARWEHGSEQVRLHMA